MSFGIVEQASVGAGYLFELIQELESGHYDHKFVDSSCYSVLIQLSNFRGVLYSLEKKGVSFHGFEKARRRILLIQAEYLEEMIDRFNAANFENPQLDVSEQQIQNILGLLRSPDLRMFLSALGLNQQEMMKGIDNLYCFWGKYIVSCLNKIDKAPVINKDLISLLQVLELLKRPEVFAAVLKLNFSVVKILRVMEKCRPADIMIDEIFESLIKAGAKPHWNLVLFLIEGLCHRAYNFFWFAFKPALRDCSVFSDLDGWVGPLRDWNLQQFDKLENDLNCIWRDLFKLSPIKNVDQFSVLMGVMSPEALPPAVKTVMPACLGQEENARNQMSAQLRRFIPTRLTMEIKKSPVIDRLLEKDCLCDGLALTPAVKQAVLDILQLMQASFVNAKVVLDIQAKIGNFIDHLEVTDWITLEKQLPEFYLLLREDGLFGLMLKEKFIKAFFLNQFSEYQRLREVSFSWRFPERALPIDLVKPHVLFEALSEDEKRKLGALQQGGDVSKAFDWVLAVSLDIQRISAPRRLSFSQESCDSELLDHSPSSDGLLFKTSESDLCDDVLSVPSV